VVDQFEPGFDAELLADVIDVIADRAGGDEQLPLCL
jgi:hypothetical protein